MRVLSWSLATLAVGLACARVGLIIADQHSPAEVAGVQLVEGLSDAIGEFVMLALFSAIGAFVAARVPRNPIGWLLLCVGIGFGLLLFTERLGFHLLLAAGAITDGVAVSLWVANWVWILAVLPMFFYVPLLFPTGRAIWPWLLKAASAVAVVFSFALMFSPGPLENYPAVESPFGLAGWLSVVRDICFALVLVCALASVASLVVRFRRAGGIERQQIKWVAFGGGVLLTVTFAFNALF